MASKKPDWLDDFLNDIVNDPQLQPVASGVESFFSDTFAAPEAESPVSAWMGSGDRMVQRQSGGDLGEEPPEETVFDRISKGAQRAWEKDPLEVLKFGAGAIGGYFDAERKNRQVQAQIDAYNGRLAAEKEQLDAHNAGISNYKRQGAGRKGPLRRLDGSQVYGARGTLNQG